MVAAASWPQFDRPIAPGASDQFTVRCDSDRPARPTSRSLPISSPRPWRNYPYQLNWADRRPIGKLHLANSGIAGKSVKNPRGYFGGRFDVRTKAGKEAFRIER